MVLMPMSARWSAGPTPESMSICAEPIVPADRITSRRAITLRLSIYKTYMSILIILINLIEI